MNPYSSSKMAATRLQDLDSSISMTYLSFTVQLVQKISKQRANTLRYVQQMLFNF